MSSLESLVKQYFVNVVQDGGFIVALDTTGVYVFTGSSDRGTVAYEFYDLKKDLGLRDEEAVLCFVGEISAEYDEETTEQSFGDWVHRKADTRSNVFSDSTLKSILRCYSDTPEEKPLLIDKLRELGLSDTIILDVLEYEPRTVRELTILGIDESVIADVLDAVGSGKYVREANDVNRLNASVVMELRAYVTKRCIASLTLELIACVFLIVLKIYPVAVIINLMGVGVVYRALHLKDNLAAKLMVLSNGVLAVVGAMVTMAPIVIGVLQSFNG